jgi:hypothetical protein
MMTKDIRAITAACMALGALSFAWILYDLFLIATDLEGVLFGSRGVIVGLSYILILFLHAAAFILILMLFSRLDGYAGMKAGSMAAIVISLFMIAVQKVMYDEVGREIMSGPGNAGEIAFVYLGLVINALFCLLVIGKIVVRFFQVGGG